MYREPWAKFTTRVTPKMMERPEATRKSEEALASPLSAWMRRISGLRAVTTDRKASAQGKRDQGKRDQGKRDDERSSRRKVLAIFSPAGLSPRGARLAQRPRGQAASAGRA